MYKIYKVINKEQELIGENDVFSRAYNQAHRLASLECKELNKEGTYCIIRTVDTITIINFSDSTEYCKYIIKASEE